MSRHGLLRSTANNNPVAPASLTKPKKRRCGEVVGGATAEFTAVVCCCPFAVMDMLALALYKAPKGMCKKAIEETRRKKKAKRILKHQKRTEGGEMEAEVGKVEDTAEETAAIEAVDLEMYDKFYGTGFWRSSSQRSCSQRSSV